MLADLQQMAAAGVEKMHDLLAQTASEASRLSLTVQTLMYDALMRKVTALTAMPGSKFFPDPESILHDAIISKTRDACPAAPQRAGTGAGSVSLARIPSCKQQQPAILQRISSAICNSCRRVFDDASSAFGSIARRCTR